MVKVGLWRSSVCFPSKGGVPNHNLEFWDSVMKRRLDVKDAEIAGAVFETNEKPPTSGTEYQVCSNWGGLFDVAREPVTGMDK